MGVNKESLRQLLGKGKNGRTSSGKSGHLFHQTEKKAGRDGADTAKGSNNLGWNLALF